MIVPTTKKASGLKINLATFELPRLEGSPAHVPEDSRVLTA